MLYDLKDGVTRKWETRSKQVILINEKIVDADMRQEIKR